MEQIRIPEFEEYIHQFGVHKYRVWTVQEEDILREYYGVIPTAMIAEHLGRSIKAIQDKAYVMGINVADNQQRRSDQLVPSQ
jgi:hypothetical protein